MDCLCVFILPALLARQGRRGSTAILDCLCAAGVPQDQAAEIARSIEFDLLEGLVTQEQLKHMDALLSERIQHEATKQIIRLGSLMVIVSGVIVGYIKYL